MLPRVLPKVDCGCGKIVVEKGMTGHLRSKFHMEWKKQRDALEDPNNSTSLPPEPEDKLGLETSTNGAGAVVDVSEEAQRIIGDPELLAQVQAQIQEQAWKPVPLLPEEEDLLARARLYEDPIQLAKGLRSIFNAHDWPNESHPGGQIDWLKEHNIPIRTLPRHLDSDGVRIYMNEWYEELTTSGWGKDWEIK